MIIFIYLFILNINSSMPLDDNYVDHDISFYSDDNIPSNRSNNINSRNRNNTTNRNTLNRNTTQRGVSNSNTRNSNNTGTINNNPSNDDRSYQPISDDQVVPNFYN